jgi:hypothetical protein
VLVLVRALHSVQLGHKCGVPRANAAIDRCIPMEVEVSRSPGSVKPIVKLTQLFT